MRAAQAFVTRASAVPAMSDMKHDFDHDRQDAAGTTSLDPAILAFRPKAAGQTELASSNAVRELQLISNQLFRAASELQRTNRFQSMILDNINQGVIVIDEYSQLVAWNEVFLRLYGLDKNALQKGMHVSEFAEIFSQKQDRSQRTSFESLNSKLASLQQGDYFDQLDNGTSIDVKVTTRETGGLIATYSDVTQHIDIQSRLKAQGEKLAAQVHELRALGHSLEIARNQAIKSDQQKSRFLAMITHDIRTPMSAVVSTMELLADPDIQTDQERLVQVALTSGRQMLYLLSDIIEVSRTDGWNFAIAAEDVSVKDLLEAIADAWRPLAEKKGLALDLRSPKALPKRMMADPKRLRQVIDNLLSNAIKFTASGSVSIKSSIVENIDEAMLRIEVSDTGRGINKNSQLSLFQDFSRIISDGDSDVEGTGLGLSICKRIVESMGGKMGVDSESALGSNFWLEIPCVQSRVPAQPECCSKKTERLISKAGTEPHILIADDVESNRLVIAAMLEKLGCTYAVAGDGEVALNLFEAAHFDAILMDNYMPNIGGAETTRRIRSMADGRKNTAIIGVTASTAKEETEELIQAGMDIILTKPLNASDLEAALKKLISS